MVSEPLWQGFPIYWIVNPDRETEVWNIRPAVLALLGALDGV